MGRECRGSLHICAEGRAVRGLCFIMYTEEKGKEWKRDKRHQGISAIVKQPAEHMESGDGPSGYADQYHMHRTAH